MISINGRYAHEVLHFQIQNVTTSLSLNISSVQIVNEMTSIPIFNMGMIKPMSALVRP